MRLIKSFFQLIRWPNLVFILLTQLLFYYAVFLPVFYPAGFNFPIARFCFLPLASILIAAAGYIINDYFDINIDEINKPDKLIINKYISRRWAIIWHMGLSFMGVVCTALALFSMAQWFVLVANIITVTLLWVYSTHFKKQLLIGNVLVSLLTAWVIAVVFFYFLPEAISAGASAINVSKFVRITLLYCGFSFIISLIREAIKDLEDINGDAKYGCRTMPVLWGVFATKMYIKIWSVILLALLVLLHIYLSQYGWWMAIAYGGLFLIIPLCVFISRINSATTPAMYHRLSSFIKWIMLAGILSMLFLKYYL